METPFRFSIRSIGDDEGEHRGEQIRRSGEQQRVDLGHAKGRHDGGDELRHRSRSGLGHYDEGQQVELVVGRGCTEALEQGHGLLIPDPGVLFESVNGDGLFPQREPSCASKAGC
jgi:hypothetical protein